MNAPYPYSSVESTLYLVDRATIQFGQFSFAPVSAITSNSPFVSYVNIYEQQLMSNAYIKNEHLTFFAKQNR